MSRSGLSMCCLIVGGRPTIQGQPLVASGHVLFHKSSIMEVLTSRRGSVTMLTNAYIDAYVDACVSLRFARGCSEIFLCN
jgi:hypothetical protein